MYSVKMRCPKANLTILVVIIAITSYNDVTAAVASPSAGSLERIESPVGTEIGLESGFRSCKRCLCSVGECPKILSIRCIAAGPLCCCCMPEVHECMDMDMLYQTESHSRESLDDLDLGAETANGITFEHRE